MAIRTSTLLSSINWCERSRVCSFSPSGKAASNSAMVLATASLLAFEGILPPSVHASPDNVSLYSPKPRWQRRAEAL